MAIESVCAGCGQRLRVSDEHAGKTAKCPRCGATYRVPSAPSGAQPPPPQTAGTGLLDAWYMKTRDGRTYGPVTRQQLDGWFREGRVGADAELRQEPNRQWVAAARVFPSLLQSSSAAAAPATASTGYTFGSESSPYRAPSSSVTRSSRYLQPHRGSTILTFGILGLLCCALFAPVAWVMGSTDSRAIREGRMNPEGLSMTQAGMILGIIGTVLMGLSCLGIFIAVILQIAAA